MTRTASCGCWTALSSSAPAAARRQKDADRERLLSAIQVVSIAALDLVLILFIICTMF